MATSEAHRDTCIHCGYSLHTLDDTAACPECGKPVRESREASRIYRQYRRFIQSIPGGWKSIITAALALFLLIVAYITFARGPVTRREFSPQTFQYRTHSSYVIPWVEWRVSREEVALRDTRLGKYLRDHGWLASNAAASSWYPISLIRNGVGRWVDRGSAIDYSVENDCEQFIAWSDKHPEMAAAVWPIVIELVQLDAEAASKIHPFMLRAMFDKNPHVEVLDELKQWLDAEKAYRRVTSP